MGEAATGWLPILASAAQEQDEYALALAPARCQSHHEGLLDDGAAAGGLCHLTFEVIEHDNTFREDTSMEKLQKLSPAFIKPHGTVTAGNSSALTDGASASLIMEKETALERGLQPKAVLRAYTYVAQDPEDELLPARLMRRPRSWIRWDSRSRILMSLSSTKLLPDKY
ncbi:MAG: hypothetical protein U5J63_17385 [Fodinibius sp.]|nr:hypothetical protein [Fodinibius sp.]